MIKHISIGIMTIAFSASIAFTPGEKAKTKTYTVDTKTSTANWLGKKVTGEHKGTIALSEGTVLSNGPGSITGGTLVFDMNSIVNTDLTDKAWNDKLIGHLKSDDFFSVDKNPTASFVITKAVATSNTNFDITGNLTIKGITNEISFPALVKMDAKTMVTVAKITVNRTKFDIKYGSASFFESIGDKAISDDFELEVNIVASAK